ncbi:hypothetical protein [Caulobacter vibrioides]|uniref:Uncharacterized protein n=2 Tax=Caulobacter vibrioides TaxID=155892 RepID=Q9A9T1_CAUVC|nr:hypothetical protein [Caulobacter vibrioides]YP_002516298.1 hypothetical protein CCNA_00925 [Caulobacter vibrioides NA1000]AAK22866.1 hypothetical protein CC_0881 [Caulobacter vibrioides CB15]ACL94390.1 hypothetical protein CCNA_00925 [Caulobacter vibrioides NA1000]ATC27720.1 hypothetical protein CA607_04680 [Caulobacter vibrioides]QXZ52961.1 hypothetical protein KZH45_04595 [Caulobacter vibrioides]
MQFDPEQARKDIETATLRARAFQAYAAAGPVIAVWGLVWIVTNLAKVLATSQAAVIGSAAMLVGIAASIAGGLLARRSSRPRPPLKSALGGATFAGLLVAVLAVAGPADMQAASAVVGLIVAAAYVFVGLMTGARIAWLGLALGLVVLAAWFGARPAFDLILALAGGGLLAGTGLWLWRQ